MPDFSAHIVVDFTPVLLGADNGGAKLMSFALLKQLSHEAPDLKFTLLIQEDALSDFKELEAPNVLLKSVVSSSSLDSTNSKLNFMSIICRYAASLFHFLLKILPHHGLRAMILAFSGFFVRRNNKLLSELNADLLFCPFTAPYYYNSRVPCVSIVYDLQYLFYPVFFSSLDYAIRRLNYFFAAKRSNVIVCISDYVRNTVVSSSSKPKENIKTIHISLPSRLKSNGTKDNHGLLANFNLVNNDYFLYPANFWAHKNHNMLITAFAILLHDRPDLTCKLVFTGAPGVAQDKVRASVEAMGLEDRCVFPGFLSNTDFATLLVNSKALIFPSLYEGFGMPLVEAFAMGVPVACSNLTSLPEVGGDAALYFDPRKPSEISAAMARLIDEPELGESLRVAGFERARLFGDSKDMALKYLKIFRELLP